MDKYERYSVSESLHQKIELHQNFRSRATVLDVYKRQPLACAACTGSVDFDDHHRDGDGVAVSLSGVRAQ